MSRNPEDLFNTSSDPLFSEDKATKLFRTAADKANAVDNTVGDKKRDIGIRTDSDEALRKAIQHLDENYRTNPDALLSDRDASDGIGQVLNILGATNAGLGMLESSVLSLPQQAVNLNDTAAAALSKALRKIPGYSDFIDDLNAIEIEGTTVGEAATRFGELVDTGVEGLADFGEFVEAEAGRSFNQGRVQKFAEEAGIAFDNADGFMESAGALISTAATNPVASAEVFAQSLPQMMALASSGSKQAISFLSITGDRIQESTDIFVKEHGREPDAGELSIILGTSLAATGLDVISSKVVLGKKLSEGTEKVLKRVTDKIVSSAPGKVVSKIPGSKVGAKVVTGAPTEAVQEGSQGVLTELGGVQDLDVLEDPELRRKTFIDATLGAGAGGVGAGGTAIGAEVREARDTTKAVAAGTKEVVDKVRKKSDIPAVAKAEGTGDPRKVVEAVSRLDLTKLKYAERRENLSKLVDAEIEIEAEIATMEDGPEKDAALQELAGISAKRDQIIAAHNKQTDVENDVNVDDAVEAVLSAENTEASPENKALVGRVFGSKQFNSDLSPEKVAELQASPLFRANASEEEQTTVDLMSQRHKTAADVKSDVVTGDAKGYYKGTNQHLDELSQAIELGSRKGAEKSVSSLKAFLDRHTKKAKIISDAIEAQKNEAGEIEGETVIDVLGSAVRIEKRTPGLLNSINKDIDAITAALAEAEHRFDVAYKGKETAETATEQVTPATTQKGDEAPQKGAETAPKTKPEETKPDAKETSLQKAIRETQEAKEAGTDKQAEQVEEIVLEANVPVEPEVVDVEQKVTQTTVDIQKEKETQGFERDNPRSSTVGTVLIQDVKYTEKEAEAYFGPTNPEYPAPQVTPEEEALVDVGLTEARGIVVELAKKFGITDIVVTEFNKPNGAAGSSDGSGQIIGLSRRTLINIAKIQNGDVSPVTARALEVIYHEFGHSVQKQVMATAPQSIIDEITIEYHAWLDEQVNKDIFTVAQARKATMGREAVEQYLKSEVPVKNVMAHRTDYETRMQEWFAEQVVKYITTKQVEGSKSYQSWIKRAAKQLVALYVELNKKFKTTGAPVQSVKEFLDQHIKTIADEAVFEVKVKDVEAAVETNPNPALGSHILENGVTANNSDTNSKDFFKPSQKKIEGLIGQIRNIFTNWNTPVVQEQLPALTEDEQIGFDNAIRFVSKLADVINGSENNPPLLEIQTKEIIGNFKILEKFNAGYLMQTNPDGTKGFNENVLMTIGLVAHNWLATQGPNTVFNFDEDINTILGRASDAEVLASERDALARAGSVQNMLAEILGREIYSRLGIELKEDVPGSFESNVEIGLGEIAIYAMLQSGHLEQSAVDIQALKDNIDAENISNVELNETVTNMIRVATFENDAVIMPAEHIQEIIKDAASAKVGLEAVYEPPIKLVEPEFEPVTTVPSKLKRTNQNVPKETKNTIRKIQAMPHTFKENMTALADFLGLDALYEIEGFNTDVEGTTNITQHDSVKGKNLGIMREFQLALDFIEANRHDLNQAFYFEQQINKNNRIQPASNTVNPVTSKIHRHMFGLRDNEVIVETEEQIKQFKYAVSLAFGGKVDAVPGLSSELHFDALLFNDDIGKAITAIAAIESGADLSAEQESQYKKDILAAVDFGGEGMHTLDALSALVKYDPSNPFKTNLSTETDGKTSGVGIGNMQTMLEEDSASVNAATGTHVDGTRDHGEWSTTPDGTPRNYDMYQRLALTWSKEVDKFGGATVAKGIEHLIGSMTDARGMVSDLARKLAKNPLMITNYGAAIKRVKQEFAESVVIGFYEDVAKYRNDPQELLRIENAVNDILVEEISSGDLTPVRLSAENVLVTKLPAQHEAAIRANVIGTYGKALEFAIESQFKNFKEYRETFNDALNMMFAAFEIRYVTELNNKEQELGRTLTKKESRDLANSLQRFMPIFKGPLSEGIEDGIISMKTKNVRQYSDEYKTQIAFNYRISNTAKNTKSVTGRAARVEYKDGGVGGMILGIHSIDSAINQWILNNYNGLNLFDAVMYGLNDVAEGTYTANKAYYEINRDYSLIQAVADNFASVMNHMNDYPLEKQGLNESMVKGKSPTVEEMGIRLQEMVERTEKARKPLFDGSQDVAVAQYPLPGITYVPAEDPQSAQFKNMIELSDDAVEFEAEIDPLVKDMLGSSSEQLDLGMFDSVNGDPLNSANSVDIFEDMGLLGNVAENAEQVTYLRNLMNDLVRGALEPLNELTLKVKAAGTETLGAVRDNTVFIKTALGTVGNAVQMSAQEVYAHEMVHMITQYALDDPKNFHIRQQILKIYNQAKKEVTIDMFLPEYGPHDPDTLRAARERYDYIFNSTDVETITRTDNVGHKVHSTRNNYLHEFVAFGLTNEKMRKQLSNIRVSKVKTKEGETLLERLENAWVDIRNWLAGVIHNTNNVAADKALLNLVYQLTELNESKRASILDKVGISQEFNDKFNGALDAAIFRPAKFLARVNPNPSRFNIPVKAYNSVVGYLAHPSEHNHIWNTIRKNIGITENNILVNFIREMAGTTEVNQRFHTLLRLSKKYIDQARKHLSEEVSHQLRTAFLTEYNEETSNSVTKAILKTDLVALVDAGYSLSSIVNLLKDRQTLKDEITLLEVEIRNSFAAEAGYYMDQAIGLGRMMARGETHIDGQMLNAHKIASLKGVRTRDTIAGDIESRVQAVDKLASLYAIHYTNEGDRQRAAELIETENTANETENGITTLLDLHRGFKLSSLRDNFGGNPNLMIKGFVTETYNPAVTIKTVILKSDPVERRAQLQELKDANFTRIDTDLKKDIKDPNQSKAALFINKDTITNTWLKSIAGLTAERVKGTTLADAYINEGVEGGSVEALIARDTVKEREDRFVERQFNTLTANTVGNTETLVPIGNDAGETVGYRYMMTEDAKDRYLEKDNHFEAVIGRMHGSVVDKQNTKQVNRKLVELNKEDFDENFAAAPDEFVEVSPRSTDPKLKEIYDLLPDQTKRDIKDVWPRGRMYVRESLIDLQFGYRKFSMSQLPVAKYINDIVSSLLPGSKYVNIVAHSENIWQGAVKIAKDFIVIKSGVVLAGNVMSNELLLMMKGVPLGTTMRDQALALSALNTFMGEVKEKNRLQRELDYGKLSAAKRKEKENRVAELSDNISTNPVKDLIDEGIFQSIAEDIEESDLYDPYSAKNRLERFVEPVTDKFPDFAKVGYKHAYFTHDTAPYKLLYRGTQYSDFIARFALYNHHMKNGMPKDQALADIIETFINYDIPTSKFMQYMNDSGAMLFTKFLFRIQKVIFKSLKGQPANNLALYSLQSVLGDASDITDSNLLTHGLLITLPNEIVDSATTPAGIELFKESLDMAGFID